MIGYLNGTIVNVQEKSCIVLTGGVGYKVFCSPQTHATLHEGLTVSFFIHTIVREDALELFGFSTEDEQLFFEQLISVSGVGPRSALSIIGLGSVQDLRSAIANNDVQYLTKVSGIGRKTAEKIAVELKDKLAHHIQTSGTQTQESSDVVDALMSLGYSLADIRPILPHIQVGDTGARVKQALKLLAK